MTNLKAILDSRYILMRMCLVFLFVKMLHQARYELLNAKDQPVFFKFDKYGKINFTPYKLDFTKIVVRYQESDVGGFVCKLHYEFQTDEDLNLVFRENKKDKNGYIQLGDQILRFYKNDKVFNMILMNRNKEQCEYLKKAEGIKLKQVGKFIASYDDKFLQDKNNIDVNKEYSVIHNFILKSINFDLTKMDYKMLYNLIHSDFNLTKFMSTFKENMAEKFNADLYKKEFLDFLDTKKADFKQIKKDMENFCEKKSNLVYEEGKI